MLSDEPVAEDRWQFTSLFPRIPLTCFIFRFPLPDVPTDWKPDPRRVWAKDKENIQEPPPPSAAAQSHAQWKKSKISAGQVSYQFGILDFSNFHIEF